MRAARSVEDPEDPIRNSSGSLATDVVPSEAVKNTKNNITAGLSLVLNKFDYGVRWFSAGFKVLDLVYKSFSVSVLNTWELTAPEFKNELRRSPEMGRGRHGCKYAKIPMKPTSGYARSRVYLGHTYPGRARATALQHPRCL